MDSTKPNTIILKFYHYQNVFNDFRLHVVLNKYSVIREAFVGRGFEFNDRDPNLMGNKYEDFSDGKHYTQLIMSFNWKTLGFTAEVLTVLTSW